MVYLITKQVDGMFWNIFDLGMEKLESLWCMKKAYFGCSVISWQ
jgi:hypothetical protein